ncbi:hypothetical protein CS8_035000 [Cupriavidus sp. 8B]|jgi:hypothetical protein
MQFGQKSERLDRQIEQLEARLEDLLAEEGAAETEAAPDATPPTRKIWSANMLITNRCTAKPRFTPGRE